MKKYHHWFAFALLALSLSIRAEENKRLDVGVLSDARYQDKQSNYHLKYIDRHIAGLDAMGLKVGKVNADIFLPENKAERNNYKRILVLNYFIFTPEMYAGMEDYVKNGGLFITNSPMHYVDMNNNYVYDKDIDKKIGNQERPHGISCFASVKLQNIVADVESPLTRGLEPSEIYECTLSMSETKAINATVLVTGTGFRAWGDEKSRQIPRKVAVLAIRNIENGAFIYIGIPDHETLFRNCFSKEVLDWLTNN